MVGSSQILSHWALLIEDLSVSSKEFYDAVEEAVYKRNLPDIVIERVFWKEGNFATAKREYVRVKRRRLAFDIGAAPYGNGHFFSWWLAKIPPRYGLLLTLLAVILLLPVWGLIQAGILKLFEDSCFGSFLSIALWILGVPAILFTLGVLIERGVIEGEEWILAEPNLAWIYTRLFSPQTYYRLDTAAMFRESVKQAVEETVNRFREGKGLSALSEEDFSKGTKDFV